MKETNGLDVVGVYVIYRDNHVDGCADQLGDMFVPHDLVRDAHPYPNVRQRRSNPDGTAAEIKIFVDSANAMLSTILDFLNHTTQIDLECIDEAALKCWGTDTDSTQPESEIGVGN